MAGKKLITFRTYKKHCLHRNIRYQIRKHFPKQFPNPGNACHLSENKLTGESCSMRACPVWKRLREPK